MNAILGYTEVLRRGYAEGEQQRDEYLGTIHSSGEHLLALINDILDLSKVEAGRMELEMARHSPHELLSQAISVLRVKAEQKGLTLLFEPAGKLPKTILTDATRLRQAIINLVGNAIKFTETGGVRVVARMVQGSSTRLAIDVIDSGVGMSADAFERIFDPFAQADTTITRRFGGSGLGLPIARQLAHQMGGDVTVQSQLGKGTTFTITIDPGPLDKVPLVDFRHAQFALPDQSQQEQPQLSLPPSRILVVDDGEDNRKLVSLVLGRAGCEVASAENGEVALRMAADNDFDVILMDMQMPVMDGLEATRRLRALGYKIPIVALTANVMKDDEQKCRDAGCSGFLTKPINLDRLMAYLSRILGGKAGPSVRPPNSPLPSNIVTSASASTDDEADDCQLILDAVTDLSSQIHSTSPVISSLPTEDPEFREIVADFVVRLEQRVVEMRQAATTPDFDELAELAHWLKGAGGSVGFDAFTTPAASLQSSAEARDEKGANLYLKAIEEITSRIQVTS